MKYLISSSALLPVFMTLCMGVSSSAAAYDAHRQRNVPPSIEINMEALDSLARSAPVNAQQPQQDIFGKPSAPLSPKEVKKLKKRAHKKAKAKKAPPKKVETAPEVKIIAHPDASEEVPSLVQIPGRDSAPSKTQASQPAEPMPPVVSPSMPVAPALPEQKSAPKPESSAKRPNIPVLPDVPTTTSAPPSSPAPLPIAPEPKPALNVKEEPIALPVAPAPASTPPKTESVPAAMPPLPDMPQAAASKPAGAMPELPPLPGQAPTASAKLPAAAVETDNADTDSKAAPAAGSTPDLRLAFGETETDLPLSASSKLDGIAAQLIRNSSYRVSIMAYASGSDAIAIYPRRVSLSRGIAVRNYLTTNKGIEPERVTVKALGNKSDSGPANRVDLFILK